ncbi:MAG: hypothetical protein KC620_04215 [Myxococcales bacterium]|nr:hypothetical protein [Myxococcales bacterium]
MWRSILCLSLVALGVTGPAAGQGLDRAYADAEALPTPVKIEQANREVAAMRGTLSVANERLATAKENRDIIQVNCVNEKLTAIKGLLRISEQAFTSLGEAAAQKDAELINHEYTKISIAALRVESFRVEVEACIGEASQYTGETQIDLSVSPDIREDDPSQAVVADVFVPINTERPPAVSGSR